ncbi:ankyrin repeat-containing domain protein [Cercophora scortea]|uniref:Ankyrin repeat-containing domain protein n=1 Tax=Cercophora scortea TaxID=314031 RepID=A0AAE0MGH1_9PEZI|nr:ankyrin repeat-containing domain protein [Cercophora scortea]
MTPVHFVTESIRELRDFGKRWNAILVLKKLLELGVYVSLLTLMDLKMTRDIHFHQPPDLDLLKLLEQRGVALETTSGEDYWTVEALYDYLYEYLKLAGDVSPADRNLITGNYQHLESLLATLVAAGAAIPPVILWHVAAAGRFDDPQDEALLLVRTEAARFFLGHGVEVNTSYNTAAETALHYAAVGHNYHMVKLLLSRGGDARAVNNKGSTPLHYACGAGHGFGTYCSSEGRKECVLALIRGGADVSARDNRGSAPVDFLVGQDSELLEILGSGVQAKRENR